MNSLFHEFFMLVILINVILEWVFVSLEGLVKCGTLIQTAILEHSWILIGRHVVTVEYLLHQRLDAWVEQYVSSLATDDRFSWSSAQRFRRRFLRFSLMVWQIVLHVVFQLGAHLRSVFLDEIARHKREMFILLLILGLFLYFLLLLFLVEHYLIDIVLLLPLCIRTVFDSCLIDIIQRLDML